eukprot:Selendium_serpulae@DN5799_c0_g1_i1.p1
MRTKIPKPEESCLKTGKYENIVKSTLSLEERFNRCHSVGEECVNPEELRALLAAKDHPICYDGFEPSGRMHVAQGILKAINVNKLTSSGCIFLFWVADWFALLNDKMSGDLNKIKDVGQYFIEVWKSVGMDMRNVRFLWASDEINGQADKYWKLVMDVARKNTVSRVKRCCTILGREESDSMPSAHVMYPCMQCADIFFLKADICQLGMDQRKVNMLAREYCDSIGKKDKPVILSHFMLPGLKEGQAKMSKSDPNSAIFMEDTEAEVNSKIKKAFCPPDVVEDNPCIVYVEKIVFGSFSEMVITRAEKNGGDVTYASIEDLKKAYVSGELHPGDLKKSLAIYLNKLIAPTRKHFEENEEAKKLLAKIKQYRVSK